MVKRSARRRIKYPYTYDKKRRALAKEYQKGNLRYFAAGSFLYFILLLVFIISSASTGLENVLMKFGILHVPLYAIILYMYIVFIPLPLAFYYGYVREHRFSLSRHTKKSWFSDFLKSAGLGYVFFTATASILFYFLQFQLWWLYSVAAYAAFALFLNYIFPVAIFPLFYRTQPYRNRVMTRRLKSMAAGYGVKINKVLVANESAKSTKANAFFAGIGHTKRIVLFDTLVSSFTPAETETVVAHELGHCVNSDVFRGIAADAARALVIFYAISLLVEAAQSIALLPVIMIAYLVLDMAFLPCVNAYSRRMEAQADWFALEVSRKPDAQISAERRLVDMALDTEQHHKLVEFFLRTHPSAEKRIKMAEEWRKRKNRFHTTNRNR